MNFATRTVFAVAAVSGAVAAAAPADDAALEALAQRQTCEWQGSERVIFAGPSDELDGCLEKQDPRGPIGELRITSRGGDAWLALQSAQALRGRLDLLVIDGLCASACANYLVPAARRVRVEPGSYVILHGSMSHRDARNRHEAIRESVRTQMRAKPEGAGLTDAQIEAIAAQTIETLHSDLAARIPVQEAFAREVLACDDWLDVRAHFGGQAPPEGVSWLLATPEMAARCLKTAKIEFFWAPEPQAALNPELGFFRALK